MVQGGDFSEGKTLVPNFIQEIISPLMHELLSEICFCIKKIKYCIYLLVTYRLCVLSQLVILNYNIVFTYTFFIIKTLKFYFKDTLKNVISVKDPK